MLLSFVNITVMSFDRYSALSKPLQYRANASYRGKEQIMLLWLQTLTHVILTCSVFLQGIIRPIKHMGGNSLMQVAHN